MIKLKVIYPDKDIKMEEIMNYHKILREHMKKYPLNALLDEPAWEDVTEKDLQEDLIALSLDLPDVIIKMCKLDNYEVKLWVVYFKNGKAYEEEVEFIYPAFDVAKLK